MTQNEYENGLCACLRFNTERAFNEGDKCVERYYAIVTQTTIRKSKNSMRRLYYEYCNTITNRYCYYQKNLQCTDACSPSKTKEWLLDKLQIPKRYKKRKFAFYSALKLKSMLTTMDIVIADDVESWLKANDPNPVKENN